MEESLSNWSKITKKLVEMSQEIINIEKTFEEIQSSIKRMVDYYESISKDGCSDSTAFYVHSQVDTSLCEYIEVLTFIKTSLKLHLMGETKKWDKIFDFNSSQAKKGEYMSLLKDFKQKCDAYVSVQSLVTSKEVAVLKKTSKENIPPPNRETAKDPGVANSFPANFSVKFNGASNLKIESMQPSTRVEKNESENCRDHFPIIVKNNNISPKSGADELKKDIKTLPKNAEKAKQKQIKGFVEHAKSPSEIYVYFGLKKSDLEAPFGQQLASLCNFYKSSDIRKYKRTLPLEYLKKRSEKDLGVNTFYYSQTDNCLHMVHIKDWNLKNSRKTVKVYFLDSGKKGKVPLEDLVKIPNDLKSSLTTRCHLHGVSDKNSKKVLKFFDEWIEKNQSAVAVFDGDFTKEQSLPVKIFDSSHNVCLNELLKKIVKEEIAESNRISNMIESWDPMTADFDSPLNQYKNADPSSMVMGLADAENDRLCKFYSKSGKCFKGEGCRKEHSRSHTRREEVYKSPFNSLALPSADDELLVKVTILVTPTKFYCVSDNGCAGTETLDSFTSFLNKAENVRQFKHLSDAPGAGELVLARHLENGAWHRARVFDSSPENDQFEVFYVDYGNYEVLGMADLRQIEPRHLHLPFQAMLCEVYGIVGKPKEGDLSIAKNLYTGLNRIKVVSTVQSEQPHVIGRVFTSSGEDVADLLLKKGIAVRTQNLILEDDSPIVPG